MQKKSNSRFDFKINELNIVKSKRSQIMGMPFSVIFSIILIIFFIVAAIIAINVFWSPTKCAFADQAQEALYKEELQRAIDEAWNSERSESEFKKILPTKITHVCFMNVKGEEKGKNADFYSDLELYSEGKNNFYLYPPKKACGGFRGMTLVHINISEITKQDNPYCVPSGTSLKIEKGFYDTLVCIGENCAVKSSSSSTTKQTSTSTCENCLSLTSSEKVDCCLNEEKCCP